MPMQRYIYGSLTRISNLARSPFVVAPIQKASWATGDYVVGKFDPTGPNHNPINDWVETPSGRHQDLSAGDLIIGALGVRKATLEAVGDWHKIGADGRMHDICGSGMFGLESSHSWQNGPCSSFLYQGHVLRESDKSKITMKDFALAPSIPVGEEHASYSCPTVLIIGTSMSCGKTTTAKAIIRVLKGTLNVNRVVGAKLAGAGFCNDRLSMLNAGADSFLDFMDVGLPSTVMPPLEYHDSLRRLLGVIAAEKPDIVVAEAGASPIEPYNGNIVLQELAEKAGFTLLCASDPFAVVGAIQILEKTHIRPDAVTVSCVSTSAGADLVRSLCKIPPLCLTESSGRKDLERLLSHALVPNGNPQQHEHRWVP